MAQHCTGNDELTVRQNTDSQDLMMQDNPLWQYSLSTYSRRAVEPLLITLQDSHKADVNILLSCGWLGSIGQRLSLDELKSLIDVSATWREQCVQPLRGVRRFLKGLRGSEVFREQIKALEVEAEQRQQALLYQQCQLLDLSSTQSLDDAAVSDNLTLYGSLLSTAEQADLSQNLKDLAELIKEQA
jgi:uncharacterized protein (TIGR02444 family)